MNIHAEGRRSITEDSDKNSNCRPLNRRFNGDLKPKLARQNLKLILSSGKNCPLPFALPEADKSIFVSLLVVFEI